METKYQQTYKQLIKSWSQEILQSKLPNLFYHTFLFKVKQYNSIAILYDDRVADIIISMLRQLPFQVFNKSISYQVQQNRRQSLFTIASILYRQQFIGKHELKKVQAEKEVYLQDKLKLFLRCCVQDKCQGDILLNLWHSIMYTDLISFWKYVEQYQIKDMILIDVYKVVYKFKEVFNNKSIIIFISKIQKKNQRQQIIVVEHVNPPKRYRRVQSSRLNETFSQINPIIFTSQRGQFKKKKNDLYQNMWFNSAKYQLYDQHINSIKETSNKCSILLNQIAYSKSLFFHPNYKAILRGIFNFIHDLLRKIDHHKIVSYQYFGSIRSTLALSCQFDIDLTSIKAVSNRGKQRQMAREDIVDLLFQIRKKLENTYPKWLSSMTVFKFQKIKVPFLKVIIDRQRLKDEFGLQGIQKLDITIGNKSAIKNSQIISYFARIPQVTLFCLLVKLWAKNNSVINAKVPMKGLSSYGIILMCIYYLMETKQICFLSLKQEELDIDKTQIIPKIDQYNVKDLDQNFLGFLEFYKQTGVFQKQLKIVCLIQNSQYARLKFDHDIVFNMYDFIDKTNPGRLPIKDKDDIFIKFQRAIRILKLGNLQQILELITTSQ